MFKMPRILALAAAALVSTGQAFNPFSVQNQPFRGGTPPRKAGRLRPDIRGNKIAKKAAEGRLTVRNP